MTFLPIVARELRVSSRRRGTYWIRSGTALVALLVGQTGKQAPRRHLITVVTSALGALLAGATRRAFAGGGDVPAAGDALLIGLLAGLAASSALAAPPREPWFP